MSNFERIDQIELYRHYNKDWEKRQCIEMTDQEYVKLREKISRNVQKEAETAPEILKKREKEESPILRKRIKNAENSRESAKKQSKRNNSKSNKAAVARVQKKLS